MNRSHPAVKDIEVVSHDWKSEDKTYMFRVQRTFYCAKSLESYKMSEQDSDIEIHISKEDIASQKK